MQDESTMKTLSHSRSRKADLKTPLATLTKSEPPPQSIASEDWYVNIESYHVNFLGMERFAYSKLSVFVFSIVQGAQQGAKAGSTGRVHKQGAQAGSTSREHKQGAQAGCTSREQSRVHKQGAERVHGAQTLTCALEFHQP
jgi:hypothetical protein